MTAAVKSADRVLDILELLAATGRSMTHAEIARRTGIPKSSLSGLLTNLVERGYAESIEGPASYRLGDGAYALARQGARIRELVITAQQHLETLTAVTGESSGLSLLREDMAERVSSADSSHAVLYGMHVGTRAPLYANSAGKVFLAWMTVAEREAYFDRVKLAPLTQNTILSVAVLRRQMNQIRAEGVARSVGEFTPGIVGVAVPVLDAHGKLLASVGVALPASRFDDAHRQRIEKALLRSAAAIANEFQKPRK